MAIKKQLRRNRGWLAFLALVVVAGAVWIVTLRSSEADTSTTTYTTEAASTGTLSVTVSGSGNLDLSSEHEAWPKTSGTVDSVEVEAGEKVAKGDVLYTLDASDAEAATTKAYTSYRQADSQVAQAEAQLSKAESSLSSLEDRAESPSSTVTSADTNAANAEVNAAEASLASAKASRSEAWSSYEDALAAEDELEVTAPTAGRVWTVNVADGDAVSAKSGSSSSSASGTSAAGTTSSEAAGSSSAPVTIAPNKPLVATLSVNEVDLPSLKVGQRADLEFDALPDLAMTGKVTEIADEGSVASGVVTFDVTVQLDVVNKQLRPGMTVAATVVTDVVQDAVLVSNSAVKTDSNEATYVLVLDASGQATQQLSVTTGLSNDTQTQIVSGLTEGQEVVTATSDSSAESDSTSDRGGLMMMGGAGGGPPAGPGGQ